MGRSTLAKNKRNLDVDMTRFVKTFVLWLLIAALPLQGIAAAAKAACGPEHHEAINSTVSDMSSHHAMSHDDEHHATMMADASGPGDHGSKHQHQHKTSFCSSCASCCVGAVAPPISLKQPSPPALSETVHIPAMPLIAGFIPAGPERPPRHLSA